jgi:hypothetical protein
MFNMSSMRFLLECSQISGQNLVDEMKSASEAAPSHHNPTPDSHADAARSSSSDTPQRLSKDTPASNVAKDADSDLQSKLDVIVSKLLVAVDASLESRCGQTELVLPSYH